MNNSAFWDITPYIKVKFNRSFVQHIASILSIFRVKDNNKPETNMNYAHIRSINKSNIIIIIKQKIIRMAGHVACTRDERLIQNLSLKPEEKGQMGER
jgi:hypothetical protein